MGAEILPQPFLCIKGGFEFLAECESACSPRLTQLDTAETRSSMSVKSWTFQVYVSQTQAVCSRHSLGYQQTLGKPRVSLSLRILVGFAIVFKNLRLLESLSCSLTLHI